MANKKKLLDRLNNAIKQVQAFAKQNPAGPNERLENKGSANFDWGFAPVVTDGKVNVGFKKSGMTPDEVLGEGVQGPVDARKYYKTQYISPEGNITRTAVYPGSYSWNTGKNNLGMTRFVPEPGWRNDFDIRIQDLEAVRSIGKRETARPEGKWLKDSNGNWYKSKNGLEIPLEEARAMKKYWMHNGGPMFDGVDMRGKKGETRVVDQDDQGRMMYEARNTKYNGFYSDRLAPNERGETYAYREALRNADNARTEALDNQIDYTYSMNDERKAAIREQIEALRAQLNNISGEESQVRKEYQNMRNDIRKYPNGAPWHKAPEDAE